MIGKSGDMYSTTWELATIPRDYGVGPGHYMGEYYSGISLHVNFVPDPFADWLTSSNKLARSISAGEDYTVALDKHGKLWAWGENGYGQLGDGTETYRSTPTGLAAPFNAKIWKSVSAGTHHTAAIDTSGKLYTWGKNDKGQLGDGTNTDKNYPVQVGSKTWKSVSVGGNHTTAIDTAGKLWTWGSDLNGQLGNGAGVTDSNIPAELVSPYDTYTWFQVSAGTDHTIAIIETGDTLGKALEWGRVTNTWMTTPGYDKHTPSALAILLSTKTWRYVSAGDCISIAIDNTGEIYYSNNLSNKSNGPKLSTQLPTSPTNFRAKTWVQVSAGKDHFTAIDDTGKIYSWGYNNNGQLGDGTTTTSLTTPVALTQNTRTWIQVSAGAAHGLALDDTGKLYSWGLLNYDQPGYWCPVCESLPCICGTPGCSCCPCHPK